MSYSLFISEGLFRSSSQQWYEGVVNLLTHLPYMILTASFWFLAVEINRRVHHSVDQFVQKWQDSVVKGSNELTMLLDRVKLLTISTQFDNHPVGISCRFFTVTYGFVGSVRLIMFLRGYQF